MCVCNNIQYINCRLNVNSTNCLCLKQAERKPFHPTGEIKEICNLDPINRERKQQHKIVCGKMRLHHFKLLFAWTENKALSQHSHTNINLKSMKTTMSGYETEMYDALCNLCSVGILGVSVAYLMPKTYFVQVCDFTR